MYGKSNFALSSPPVFGSALYRNITILSSRGKGDNVSKHGSVSVNRNSDDSGNGSISGSGSGVDSSNGFGTNSESSSGSGIGSGSVVYKAWHKQLRKPVVVKVQSNEAAKDPMLLHIEAEALKNVTSPYLPKLLDFYTYNELSCTVLEFIEGESFDRLLRRGERFTSAQVLKWYRQLSVALEAIHEAGVCHRDIKPANIMLKPDGDICLIDFNAASVRGVSTRFVSRSNGYASPEQDKLFEQINNTSLKTSHASRDAQKSYDQPVLSSGSGEAAKLTLSSDDNSTTDITDCSASLISQISICVSPGSDNSILTSMQLHTNISNIDWKRSDIYSLGATMRHILTGRRFYSFESAIPDNIDTNAFAPVNLYAADSFDMVKWRKAALCRKCLRSIIEISMMCNPSMRFDSARALSHVLEFIINTHR